MINDYHSEEWTDLLEGILQKMTEKISENRQRYKTIHGNEVVSKVKQVLKEHFHSAYMVTETYGAKVNINLNQQQPESTTQIQQQLRVMCPPLDPARVKTTVLNIQEKHVLVEGGRNISTLADIPLLTSENVKMCHSLIFSNNMCMIITGTKAWNRYMNIAFSLLFKIRSDMMDKPIPNVGGKTTWMTENKMTPET